MIMSSHKTELLIQKGAYSKSLITNKCYLLRLFYEICKQIKPLTEKEDQEYYFTRF